MTIPTRLHELRGNPSRRVGGPEPQPVVLHELPEPPEFLSEAACNEWWRLGGELQRLGLLTVADTAVFAAYCQAYGRWFEAERLMRAEERADAKNGGLMKDGAGTTRVPNPLLRIAANASDAMVTYAAQLGLTPISRRRIAAAGQQRPSKFTGLLASG